VSARNCRQKEFNKLNELKDTKRIKTEEFKQIYEHFKPKLPNWANNFKAISKQLINMQIPYRKPQLKYLN
jgi:hypothetical protein